MPSDRTAHQQIDDKRTEFHQIMSIFCAVFIDLGRDKWREKGRQNTENIALPDPETKSSTNAIAVVVSVPLRLSRIRPTFESYLRTPCVWIAFLPKPTQKVEHNFYLR